MEERTRRGGENNLASVPIIHNPCPYNPVDGTSSRFLRFSSSDAYMGSRFRGYGYSVRCLKD